MPIVASNPWQDAAAYGGGFGAQIANMLAQQPQIRLQLAQLAQQAQVNQANIGEKNASAGLYQAQTEGEKQKNKFLGEQPQALSNVLTALIANNPAGVANAVGPLGYGSKDPAGQTSMFAAILGANPTKNPLLAAQIQGGKEINVPANALGYSPLAGGTNMPGPILLRPGQSAQQPGGPMVTSPVAPPQRSDIGALGNLLTGIPKGVETGVIPSDAGSNIVNQVLLPALLQRLAQPQGGSATGVPQQQSAMAVPPAAQRQVGQVYDTPKGKFRWTGTGWEPAQ